MMGRPPKLESDRRDKPLRIRLTNDERDLLDNVAEKADKDTSAWARDVLLRAAKRAVKAFDKTK